MFNKFLKQSIEAKEVADFKNEFNAEELELLVLIEEDVSGAIVCNDYYKPSVRFLASVDIKTGKVSYEKGLLTWIINKKQKIHNYGYSFKSLSIYHVRVRKCIEQELVNRLPIWNNRYFLVEIIGKNKKNLELENVREEYLKPVSINNELGNFTLNKRFNWFEGTIKWMNDTCDANLIISSNLDEKEELMNILYKLCNDMENWDKKIREFAAQELTSGANDWQNNDEDIITEEEFAKRIYLSSFSIYPDGSMEIYFDDDDMFWGHTIIVYCNISGEFEYSDIAG